MSKDFAPSPLDYWHLCDELNIVQAALLIVGEDPAENWGSSENPPGYKAVEDAISRALKAGRIKGRLVAEYEYDLNGSREPIDGSISLRESTVEVTSLKEWLVSRGMSSGFFFAREPSQPGYLDPGHPRYAPKLAAAVTAWQSFEEFPGRSPKWALSKWLREHAAEFGLSDDEGKPNETGIEEVAKVANWQLGGGAPKTPGG